MSKKTKSAAKLRRRKMKHARKEAQAAKYAAFAAAGNNRKSKRNRIAAKKGGPAIRMSRHVSNVKADSTNSPLYAPKGSFLHNKLFTSSKFKEEKVAKNQTAKEWLTKRTKNALAKVAHRKQVNQKRSQKS